jgi:hypothetical protein
MLSPTTETFNLSQTRIPRIFVPELNISDVLLDKYALQRSGTAILKLNTEFHVYELHCPVYSNATGQSVVLLPQFKIPRFKFHVTIYFYALFQHIYAGLSLRKAAAKTRQALGLSSTEFSHTTLMRFRDRLAGRLSVYPLDEELVQQAQSDGIWETGPDGDLAEQEPAQAVKTGREEMRALLTGCGLDMLRDRRAFRLFCESLAICYYRRYCRFLN